ncbi:S1 family peptidase [Actinomadura sp. 1N219]|uniref:S1 family peptidase n=1 Tax=Actinomadura sp. 1N219 TaxID=3375152 RepID=UPI003787CB25
MRPIPLTMLVSGTAIIVATAPYMITQAPDSISAPAPAPAPAPDSESLPDAEPTPETDFADESARGYGARASGADPSRGRSQGRAADGRSEAASGASGGTVVQPPVVAAPAPGSAPAPDPDPGPDRDPNPAPDDDPPPSQDPAPDDDPPPDQEPQPDPDEPPHGLMGPPDPEGGESIFAPGGVRCTLGFNVRKADSYYFLTTGACAEVGLKLYADPTLRIKLGTVVQVTNGTTALVRYVSPHTERPGSVGTPTGSQDVTGTQSPRVGQRICRINSDTGTECGTVTALNTSVTSHEGTIRGLARTTICTEPGDTPGAPYLSGTFALGMGFGASGNCSSGGTTYIQPVSQVLDAFGVEVY